MLIDFLLTILILIAIIGLLVFIHELGHFIAARIIGVEVEEFAFGFGKKLLAWERGDTIYRINMLPFGGYVKILGDEDPSSFVRKGPAKFTKSEIEKYQKKLESIGADKGSKISILKKIGSSDKLTTKEKAGLRKYMFSYIIPNDPDNMDNKGYFQKLFVAVAGVTMNMILAFVIFAVYLSILGYKTDLVYIADYPFVGADAEIVQKPIVAKVYNKQLAEQGFSLDEEHYGVIIISLDGEYINDFDEFTAIWNRIENKPVDVEYIFLDNMLLVKSNLVLNSPGYDINIEPSLTDKIIFATVEEGFPADKADIKPRDILLKIDGEPAGYEKRTEFIEFLENNKNRSMVFTVLSEDGEIIDKKVELNGEDKDGVILGSSFSLNKPLQGTQYRLDYSDNKYLAGVAHTINVFGYNPVALYNLMKISIETKDVELASQSVSSIWGVGETLNTLVINRDYKNIINLTGLISVALAFMNILPIPLLDGGQVLFITLEKLRGKPLSAKTQERIANVAFIFLIGFSILIIAKDVWIGFVGDFFRGIL